MEKGLSCYSDRKGGGGGVDWQLQEATLVISSLKDIFKKSTSLLAPLGALPSLCFSSFGVLNVSQRGIMEKGNLKSPQRWQQDGRAVRCSSVGGLTMSACQQL